MALDWTREVQCFVSGNNQSLQNWLALRLGPEARGILVKMPFSIVFEHGELSDVACALWKNL